MGLARLLLTLFLLVGSNSVLADKNTRFNYDWYLAGGIWNVGYNPDAGASYNLPGAVIKAGYEFNRQVAVEAHFGLTDGETRSVFGGTVPSVYVLELGAGQAAAHGVAVGSRLEF